MFLLLFGSCLFLSLWWYSHIVHAPFSWFCLVSTCAFKKLSEHLYDSNFEFFTWQFICLLLLSLVSGYLNCFHGWLFLYMSYFSLLGFQHLKNQSTFQTLWSDFTQGGLSLHNLAGDSEFSSVFWYVPSLSLCT